MTGLRHPPTGGIARTATPLLAGAMLLIVLLVLGRLWWLPAHAPLNINEGWNTGQALRALGAGALYPSPEALTANNYPPLSFYIVGAAGSLFGDLVVTGRVVALLAQVASGWAVSVVVLRLAPGTRWAVVGAVLFGGFSATLLRSYVAMNDPQWLGHAAMCGALVLLVPREAGAVPSARRIVGAAALIVAGGLIKHNLVAIPIAVTAWLWLADRRAFATWIAAGAAFAGVAAAVLLAVWGTTVFVDVLAPARSYSLLRMATKGGPLVLTALPALLACRPLLTAWRGDSRLALPAVLLAVALPIGIVQRSGSGVDVNAFFEAVIAICIAVPVACARRSAPGGWIAITALPALCLVPLAAAQDVRELAGRDAAVRHWQPFIARIAAAPGPVACDDQAICYWAGRTSALDFFSIKQRLLKGRGAALRPALDRGYFAMIVMRGENPGWQENLLTPAIHARYRVVYRDDGIELLIPQDIKRPAR